MPTNFENLKNHFTGDIETDTLTLDKYSHDASLFQITPTAVVFPKSESDIQSLVRWVGQQKSSDPNISITARAAGTCMSGGSINDSIIMDITRYMNQIISISSKSGIVEPGCYYRDFEKQTLKGGVILPTYTASKEICAIGGMVGNNAGGEKSLKYGKTADHVLRQKLVLNDGSLIDIAPLTKPQLDLRIQQNDREGEIYKQLFALIDSHYDLIQSQKPTVSKNSAGYALWNVWNRDTDIFDLNQLIVGAQGTLGITTEVEFDLIPTPKYSGMLVVFLPDISRLGELVDTVLPFKPDSIESYDDQSMLLAIKYFADFIKMMGLWGALKMGLQFLPELGMLIRGGIPKLFLLIECTGNTPSDVLKSLLAIQSAINRFGYQTRIAKSATESEKYWRIRRESFNLLRKHIQGKRTAPFIDDVCVSPTVLPQFLPKMQKILADANLVYTIAGHAGNGNFHIIPLMDLDSPFSADQILDVSDQVYRLVAEYHGTITAEHNDGIIRTPYLKYQFSPEMIVLFEETKRIFDPQNIFNPGKKVFGTIDCIRQHLTGNKNPRPDFTPLSCHTS